MKDQGWHFHDELWQNQQHKGKPKSQTNLSPMSAFAIMSWWISFASITRGLGFGSLFGRVVLQRFLNFERISDSTRSVWNYVSLCFSRPRHHSKFPIGSPCSIARYRHSLSVDVKSTPRDVVRLNILRWRGAAWEDWRWGEAEACVPGISRCLSAIMTERGAFEMTTMNRKSTDLSIRY